MLQKSKTHHNSDKQSTNPAENNLMLANAMFFSDLAPADLDLLSGRSTTKIYPKNRVLINEGDESDALYVILKGKVKVFIGDEDGKEVTLSIQGQGEYFGELALMDGQPRSASVVTMEPSRFAIISKVDFQRCLVEHPEIAIQLIQALSKRIRILTENVRNMALLDVYGRVAHQLLGMATQQGETLVIEQKLTHQDIANLVGASREMVSRIMKDLIAGGYIGIKNKKITINHKLPLSW